MRRSRSSSWVCSRRAMLSRRSARCRCIASAWRWASWCSRSASGVSDTRDRSRASSAVSARWASCSSDTARSSRSWRSRLETSRRRRSTRDLDIGGQSTSRATGDLIPMRDDAPVLLPPSHPRRTTVATTLVLLVSAACGGDDAGYAAGGPITREAPASSALVRVLGDDTDEEYTSDPPTSGPHQTGPAGGGNLDDPISRPMQVGILEQGSVLVQYAPDLPAADVTPLHTLAGPGVVVAPNPDLPAPVVATAWTYKRTCEAV